MRQLLAVLLVLWAVPAWAATYYVTKTGNDGSGNGSVGSPWLTIGKCASTLVAGDTCLVGDGTYTETPTLTTDGVSNQRITYQAVNNRLAILAGFFTVNGDYTTIDGFTVIMQTGADYGAVITGAGVTFQHNAITAPLATEIAVNARAITVTGSYALLHDNFMEQTCMGIDIDAHYVTAEYNEIKNMVIRHAGPSPPLSCGDNDYVRVYGTHHTIRYNYTYGVLGVGESHQDCIQTYEGLGSAGVVTDLLYEGNFCAGAGQGPMLSSITTGGINRVTFRNNVFHVLVNAAVINDSQNVHFFNNTFIVTSTDSTAHGPHCYPRTADLWTTSCEFKNNIIVSDGTTKMGLWYACLAADGCTMIDGAVGAPGTNNLLYEAGTTITGFTNDLKNQNPQFSNTVGNTYYVGAGSPALNAGYSIAGTSWASPTDKLGVSRPQGIAWDIGAYEGIGGVAPPAAPTGVRIR